MFQVQLANNKRADLFLIMALWQELTSEWYPDEPDPLRATMLRGHVMDSMATYLNSANWPDIPRSHAARACRFDTVLRLASGSDGMHATAEFFTRGDNSKCFLLLEGQGKQNPARVALTSEALATWQSSDTARMQAITSARALLESDIESKGIIISLLPAAYDNAQARARPAPARPALPADESRHGHLQALVQRIQDEPYQPIYWRKPFGVPVVGWDARLKAYFWPDPSQDYAQSARCTVVFAATARELADALGVEGHWNDVQQAKAVGLAKDIFGWGDVRQNEDDVTASNIEQVFRAALENNGAAKAKMNSGWTKVAAFATAHLEEDGQRHPQTIWDSRVATALVSRIDAQLDEGMTPADLFPGIGTVSGQGGTRPRALTRRWPSSYGKWSGQVAGSALVRDIRDILNRGDYPKMPLPDGGVGPWTTRGVEMVLFMDGY